MKYDYLDDKVLDAPIELQDEIAFGSVSGPQYDRGQVHSKLNTLTVVDVAGPRSEIAGLATDEMRARRSADIVPQDCVPIRGRS